MDFLVNQFSNLFQSAAEKSSIQSSGGSQEDKVVELKDAGAFYYIEPTGPATIEETLVYKSASLSIIRLNPFKYKLVVSRNLDDQDEDFELDPSITDVDEFEGSFLLSKSLKISRSEKSIIWADCNDETLSCGWKFVASSCTLDQVESWEEQLYLCLFEVSTRKECALAKDDELLAFLSEATEAKVGVWKGRSKAEKFYTPKKPIDDAASPFRSPSSGQPKLQSSGPPAQKASLTFSPLTNHASGKLPEGTSLVKVLADLYYFDKVQAGFVPHLNEAVFAEIRQTGAFLYHLIVTKQDGSGLILQKLEQRMNPFCDFSSHSFTWVWFDPETDLPFVSWSLHFGGQGKRSEEEEQFNRVFYGSMYESVNRESLAKAKSEQQEYLSQVFQDMDDMQVDEEEDEDEDQGDKEEGAGKKAIYESAAQMPDQGNNGEQNSLLAVGYRNDRSFVVRGSKIGVFRHADNNLEFATTINNIADIQGSVFSPHKVMLHQQDSKLIMMNSQDSHKLHVMDLEYGKVVDEWNVDENVPITDILPESKYAQLSHSQTLLGINSKAMFKLDGRQGGNKMVSNSLSQYKTKVGFSAAATTGSGQIAVASEKGEIRLFDRVGISRAKTALPGVGDPILGMDTTEDGKYILATCATYLLVIETQVQGETKSAFEKSIKTKPKRLQLKPEHVAWMGHNISFTPARFDTGENSMERSIITSTGPYVITWNFRKVKNGRLHEYNIKKYGENVVADNFKYGADKSIIVALPSNVEMVSKSTLQTPTKMLKSRSNIVNSPY